LRSVVAARAEKKKVANPVFQFSAIFPAGPSWEKLSRIDLFFALVSQIAIFLNKGDTEYQLQI
jgi:hypothetical protein